MEDRARMSRAEQRQRTRSALVAAAARTFARDGYHGASLEEIAATAGYSKGAVYSNFRDKAELFLAVLDVDIDLIDQQPLDLFAADPTELRGVTEPPFDDWDPVGISLATLEFLAVAARDANLAPAMRQRVQRLVDHFTAVARHNQPEDDPLSAEQLGLLLTALDQGFGLLYLLRIAGAGGQADRPPLEAALWAPGLRRLANPERAGAAVPDPPDAGA